MVIEELKLYPDKSEFLFFGTRHQLKKVKISHIIIFDSRINPATQNISFVIEIIKLTKVQKVYIKDVYSIKERTGSKP